MRKLRRCFVVARDIRGYYAREFGACCGDWRRRMWLWLGIIGGGDGGGFEDDSCDWGFFYKIVY